MEQAPKTDTSAFWQLSWKIGVIGLVIFIVGCFFTDYQSWGLGVLIGTAFTILRLKLMELSIRHAVQMDEAKKASGYGNFQFMLRQFLAVVVLAAVAIAPGIDPIGAVLPMFGMQLASYWQSALDQQKAQRFESEVCGVGRRRDRREGRRVGSLGDIQSEGTKKIKKDQVTER